MLSPTLFTRYIRDLLGQLANSYVDCNVGGLFVNVLAYADCIVLLAPSWNALQQLLIILEQHIADIDMESNIKKTVCMIFEPLQPHYNARQLSTHSVIMLIDVGSH